MLSLNLDVDRDADESAARAEAKRTEAVDFAIALTSGPNAWATPDSASTPMMRACFVIALTGVLVMSTVTVAEILGDERGRPIGERLLLAAAAVLAMATMGSSAVAAIRRQRHRGGRHSMLAWRVGAVVVLSEVWISTIPPELCGLIWPVGLLIGAEAALTARLIGHDRPITTLYANYLMSSLHLGAITAAGACLALVRTDVVLRLVIAGIGSLEVAAVASVLTYGVLRHLLDRELQFGQAIQTSERTEEFRRRAHWIHDDVCADLRELRVKMASQTLDNEQVSLELDRLDDRLRERQLDEMLNGGRVAAAEILQSYVRRAQTAGVLISEVPRFEAASVMLTGEPARLLRRCTAGFVSNALTAGARTLGFQLSSDRDDLLLSVTDDAGGFDLADAPAGRGLASIAAELGSDRLTSVRHDGGTMMMARIPLS